MGQSVVELPDPMEAGAVDSAANTDDLLSQLAGDEIDRLLAEADGEGRAPAKSRPVRVDEPIKHDERESPGAGFEAVDESVTVMPTVSDRAGETTTGNAESSAVDPAPASAAEAVEEELAWDEAETHPLSAAESASLPSVLDEVLTTAAEKPSRGAWLVLLPLHWLNKPFENLDDRTRSLLGKVGIITLLNAAAVLGYVLFLRR